MLSLCLAETWCETNEECLKNRPQETIRGRSGKIPSSRIPPLTNTSSPRTPRRGISALSRSTWTTLVSRSTANMWRMRRRLDHPPKTKLSRGLKCALLEHLQSLSPFKLIKCYFGKLKKMSTLILMFHHIAHLTCQFWQIPICPSRTGWVDSETRKISVNPT